ncbi:MAG: double zinc ribbon domain-containing protein [Elusimicrobiota bacterium]|jgi:ComF family protein|nr:double zinc ribbon domain-containing protein [Elusimicrobiota bacterium]
MRKIFSLVKSWVLYILFPRVCFCCGADVARNDGNPLCPECMKDLKPVQGLICRRCGLPLPDGGALCYGCRIKKNFKCGFIRSGLKFTPASRALAHAFKYGGYTHLSRFFAPFMYNVFRQNPEFFEADFLVPVPIHKSRRRERGFNQSLLLALDLSRLCGVPCAELLVRKVKTRSQTSLGRKERLENIKEAFACANAAAVRSGAIILIDDVCTTSATLEECAGVLRKAGAREVLAITALRE